MATTYTLDANRAELVLGFEDIILRWNKLFAEVLPLELSFGEIGLLLVHQGQAVKLDLGLTLQDVGMFIRNERAITPLNLLLFLQSVSDITSAVVEDPGIRLPGVYDDT